MKTETAFAKFAPTILKVYRRDKEAFWKAIMTPFLANQISLSGWLQTIKVDVGLLSAFKGLDDEAQQTLKDFSVRLGLGKDMIAQSRSILAKLNDEILVRLVDVTESRLDSFFRKELKMK
jgi:hypothetical protein